MTGPPARTTARAVRTRALLLSLLALALAAPQPAAAQDPAWQPLAPGIDYREFRLPGPNRAYVTRLDRTVEAAVIDTSLPSPFGETRIETVSRMASRHEQVLAAWPNTWGARYDVVAAINGSYYNRDSGEPEGLHIHSGWFTTWRTGPVGGSAFVWTRERQAAVALCLTLPHERQQLTHLPSGATFNIAAVDSSMGRGTLALYTPLFRTHSPGGDGRTEIVLELPRPLWMIPQPRGVEGRVLAIHNDGRPHPIPFNAVVLAARGEARLRLLELTRPGDAMRITLEAADHTADCAGRRDLDLTGAYAGLGAGYVVLRDGEVFVQNDPNARAEHPRTAIAINERYVYFVVVDGRAPGYSLGMTHEQLALFCREVLGAQWAVSQDGGGSSTLWANGAVRNRPSDGSERPVANGLFMAVLEPMVRSEAFAPGDRVVAVLPSALRAGPGVNYAELAPLAVRARGVIADHLSPLNGVLATGAFWWKLTVGEVTGWAPQDVLLLIPGPPPRGPIP